MTVAVKLTARLMVVLALINCSYGTTTEAPSTIAANTAVVSITGSADMSTATDSTESSASVPEISTAPQSTLSSSEILLESSTGASFTASALPSAQSTPTTDTPFLTTTSLGTEDNSTEDAVSTASTTPSTTTTSTTTSIPSTTTKPPPPGTQEPDFAAAPLFKMTFSIGYEKLWDESFRDCSSSQECQAFREQIQKEIDLAFIGCPGYKNSSIAVIRFYNNGEEVRRAAASQLQAVQFAANGTETYAEYNASFDSFVILSQSTDVVSYIDSTVEAKLANNSQVINGSTDGMVEAANAQVSAFSQSSCQIIGKEICPTTCYPCTNGDIYQYNVGCQTKCDADHICTEDPDKNVNCVCKPDYLPFGEDCVHENVIIGITAGVGGAIVLCLLITAIVLGCKLRKKNKQYDHLKDESNSHHRAEAYEMANHNGVRKSVSAHDVELHDDGHSSAHRTEPFASAREEHEGHGSEMAKENHHNHYQPDQTQKKVDELKTDYDDTPIGSLNKQGDHFRKLYYSMPDNPGSSSSPSDPYAYFIARLNKVDVNKEYHIKRPQVEHPHYNNGAFF